VTKGKKRNGNQFDVVVVGLFLALTLSFGRIFPCLETAVGKKRRPKSRKRQQENNDN
jgi:hypothetical protein